MMDRKSLRILLLSIIDPKGDRGGAGTATRGFLELLQRDPLDARIECVLPTSTLRRFHRVRQLTSVARSLVSPLPSKAVFTYSRRFLRAVKRALHQQEFDLVLLNGSDLFWLLPALPPRMPRTLLAHNIEHSLFLSQINSVNPPSPVRRMLLRDWRRLQEYELSGLRRIEHIIFLSSQDAEFAQRECPHIKTLVVPPLFDYQPPERLHTKDPSGMQIGFLANFGWWPNREGLRWFLKGVFPYTDTDTRLHLFGEKSCDLAPHHPRIVHHGFLSKTQDVWPICDFMICPVFSGGGASIKFAEAVYNGVPMLASSFAARGLPLKPDPSIILLDHAEEWVRFLRSPAAQALRSRRVPAPLAEAFRMEVHVEPVRTFIREVIQSRVAS